ncbi:MAG: hypothetical protein ACI9NT_000850, partial [Bacteroidia bacterium]
AALLKPEAVRKISNVRRVSRLLDSIFIPASSNRFHIEHSNG